MAGWIVVGVTSVIGLVFTLVALFAEDRSPPLVPPEPAWLVPAPYEVRNAHFPRVWRGYHPASVDVFVAALATAYEALYDLAGPDVIAQARERLARRRGQARYDTHESPKGPGEEVR